MKITQAEIKYYGTLAATLFVLFLSTEHISEALKVVEKIVYNDEGFFSYMLPSGTWLAAAGLQVFEVLTAIGIADLIERRKKSNLVIGILILILVFFFLINLSGNILYAVSSMVNISGRDLLFANIEKMDKLQKFWVLWAAVPIPLMGLAGVTVQAIFKKDLKKSVITNKKETTAKPAPEPEPEKQPEPGIERPY